MAKARAIVKRRKAVRNTRKITKTMQMIATAKFQKSLKRAVGTKPFTFKVRELVADLVEAVGDFKHPLIDTPDRVRVGKSAVLVITGNRGLAGAYNGNVLRASLQFIRGLEERGEQVELHTAGKKAYSFFNFQKRVVAQRHDALIETQSFPDIRALADRFMAQYAAGEIDAVYIVYMNFISTGVQKPDVLKLLPLVGAKEISEHLAQQARESEAVDKKVGGKGASAAEVAQMEAQLHARGQLQRTLEEEQLHDDEELVYEFSPSAGELLDELLPITVRATIFQCFMDATTSENVARMVAMKAATDNADKMIKSLTMQYNRARQSQITTELSEIMGGVEAMKS